MRKTIIFFLFILLILPLSIPSVKAEDPLDNITYVEDLQTGLLSVDTTPVQGEIFVDDVSWGIAPRGREVTAGNYTVSFGPFPYYMAPTSVDVEVFQNQTTTIIGKYTPISAAYFVFDNLTITPPVVEVGNPVTINVSVINAGDISGADLIILVINGTQVESDPLVLHSHESTIGSFTYVPAEEGFHRVLLQLTWRDICEGNFTVLPIIQPAAFTFSNLAITPPEVTVGEDYTVSLLVTNIGDLEGSIDIYLMIGGTDYYKVATLAGGQSSIATFTPLTATTVGTFVVTVNTLTGTLTVNPVDSNLLYLLIIAIIIAGSVILLYLNRRR